MENEQTDTLKVNDLVQYMHISRCGSATQFSTRKGRIKAISGTTALVVRQGGRKESVALSELTRQGRPSPVNVVFKAFAQA